MFGAVLTFHVPQSRRDYAQKPESNHFVPIIFYFSLISISRSLEFGIMVLFLKQSILILYFEKNQFNIGAKTVLNSLELM